MWNNELRFVSIEPAIYASRTMEELWQQSISDLRDDGNIFNAVYANKLEELHNMFAPIKLQELKLEFNALKIRLEEIGRQYGVLITLKGRRKDFVGINKKIRLYLLKKEPIDKLLDIFGFRVIVKTGVKDSPFSIKICYEVMNEIIKFFVTQSNCNPLQAEPLLDTGFDEKKYAKYNIVIPKTDMLLFGFDNNVKDYVVKLKNNGYQSLHVIFKKPNGLIFEVQVRTEAMDWFAEYGPAAHLGYKIDRYKEAGIDVDFSKVNMQGFRVLENGEIVDDVGLCKPIPLFELQ